MFDSLNLSVGTCFLPVQANKVKEHVTRQTTRSFSHWRARFKIVYRSGIIESSAVTTERSESLTPMKADIHKTIVLWISDKREYAISIGNRLALGAYDRWICTSCKFHIDLSNECLQINSCRQ